VSGIAGMYSLNGGTVRQEDLEVMVSSLTHRGPDGCKIWRSANVGFVHCSLKTTPEALAEYLPYRDEITQIVITADARIDNRDDLIKRIGIDYNSRIITDSEIILEAYKKWGKACAIELIGDFAFAIWDPRLKQLFCARDHIGTRPFFYYICNSYMVFSSEIKSILAVPQVSTRINDKRIADFLNLKVDNNSYTFFKNIYRLPPATALWHDGNIKSLKSYWRIGDIEPCLGLTNLEYAEKFRGIFLEAVRCRLRTITPVGCSFSGGLDSSSVLSSARLLRSTNEDLHAFSFNFDKLPCGYLEKSDEREYQRAVITEGGVKQHCINGNNYKPFEDISLHLNCHGEPFFFPHLYLSWRLWECAGRQENIRVMLDGLDGDSVISHGYEHLQQLALNLHFFELVQNLIDLSRVQDISLKRLFYMYIAYPFFRAPLAYLYKTLKVRAFPHSNINDIITKDFASAMELHRRTRPELTSFLSARKMHERRLTNTLLTMALETMNSFTAGLNIENRSPFFDRRVMELCFSLPSGQKLQSGWTRSILRQAMKYILAEKVRTRVGKSNLTFGFVDNLLKNHHDLVDEVVHEPHSYLSDRIDQKVLQQQWQKLQEEPFSCPGRYHLNMYNMVVLNSWLNGITE